MKRLLLIFLVFIIVLLLVSHCYAADLDGGYYFVADCALGSNVKFYVASDSFSDLTFDSSGDLFNLGNSTVYLYCPDYPTYSIRAARFSNFVYSIQTGYNPTVYDLNVVSISDSNISFLVDTPQFVSNSSYFIILIAVVILFLFILAFLFRRG